MPYYPKSQIKTNLYTNGEELFTINGQSYIGYYHQLSNGKTFSGKTPQDIPNFELFSDVSTPILLRPQPQIFSKNPSLVSTLTNLSYPKFVSSIKSLPVYNPNIPTPEDYKIGEFRRYFCKRTNEIKYTEIDKNTFNLLLNQSPTIEYTLFIPFYLDWQLTGNEEQVARVNKNNAELTAQRLKLPGLLEYLRFDFTKYYK
jgi:hypothetical protein